MSITLLCPAKINLFLAIRGKDSSGYHEIETVLARTMALQDKIEIASAEKLEVEFLPEEGIDPENNTITKAVQLLEVHTRRPLHYRIRVTKKIPPQSGLGGAASNAATILLYLNEQEKIGLTHEELMELAARIGMDVPFFVSGHEVALATHYGERITPLTIIPPQIRIELTGHAVSTKDAYAKWDDFIRKNPNHQAPQNEALYNDFELITPECGPYTSKRHLCGSGGAVYHITDLPSKAD